MPPPDTVALASPLPNSHFGTLDGHPLAGYDTVFQHPSASTMPSIPHLHLDYFTSALKMQTQAQDAATQTYGLVEAWANSLRATYPQQVEPLLNWFRQLGNRG